LNIAFGKFGGLADIISKKGSIRSNHYHKTDYHFLQVMMGAVHYYWRPAGSKEEPKIEIFRPGDVFFTPPMVEHAVYSPHGSEMLSISHLSRRHADHEADLIRVPLIKLEGGEVVTCR
jgi:quercetin dioxygenase-like cupin family protein